MAILLAVLMILYLIKSTLIPNVYFKLSYHVRFLRCAHHIYIKSKHKYDCILVNNTFMFKENLDDNGK